MTESVAPSRRFRLRGRVGEFDRTHLLVAGENRIGSVRENDIVLPVRGVSRRHAILVAGADALTIEDLQSKNGVVVNGVRVQRSSLRDGDELTIGPIRLRLEEVDAADTQMGLAMPAVQASPSLGLPSGDTTAVSAAAARGDGAWLRIVEGFLSRLTPDGDLSPALSFVLRELPAQGVWVLDCTGAGEAALLGGVGRLENLAQHEGFGELRKKAAQATSADITTARFPGEPALSCALMSGPVSERLGLAVWEDAQGRSDSEPLLQVLLALVERSRPRPRRPSGSRSPAAAPGLVFPEGYVRGESRAMASLYAQMLPLLKGDVPVLILGETGVGKEYLARILHASSARARGPLVAINCAAIPAELLEAELFGIGKGVATGVVERQGKFQLAEGGTLFLDEIGDMSLGLQSKLLRALQEKEIHPVGGGVVKVDIRVLSATNTDLLRRIEDGRFRRDLYYRVAGYALQVPPLWQRQEDIPGLVEGFIRVFSKQAGKAIRGVTIKALRALSDYRWPGNIRELEHEVRRLVYLCPDGEAIDSTMLSDPVTAPAAPDEPADDSAQEGASLHLEEHVQKLEARLIQLALRRASGNRTKAASYLGISRNGLAIKMERLGITG